MPPALALSLGVLCCALLLWLDSVPARGKVSSASWIPTFWLLIAGSRPVSNWFVAQVTNRAGESDVNPEALFSEGSPFDRNIFILLIVAGICILFRRRIVWRDFARQNPWVLLFAVYGGLGVLWSDVPIVSFKRWCKLGGNVVMATVVATEAHATEAYRVVLARCAYILIPLSIVLIKYYGDYGRRFSPRGDMMVTGVTTHKNLLGTVCMIVAIFLVWSWTSVRNGNKPVEERWRLVAHLGCGGMVLWLLLQANSATSAITASLGVIIVALLKRWRGSSMRLLTPALLGLFGLLAALYSVGVAETIIVALGKDATLTGRTDLWAEVLAARTNPAIGAGFESFWLGSVAARLWGKYWWHPNQAHNGYIETYLNLGIIGLVLLCGCLAHIYRTSMEQMRSSDFDLGRFRLTFVLVASLYNVTEAAFHGLSMMWVVLVLVGVKWAAQPTHSSVPLVQPMPGFRGFGVVRPSGR